VKPRARKRKLLDRLAFEYGLRPWMLLLILVLVLSSGLFVYLLNRGSRVIVPVPGGVEVPVAPSH
jgi:hypothetical protein